MSSYSDEDVDIHVHRGGGRPVRYVSPPRARRSYYDGPSFLAPEQRTTVVARSASRSRSRERPRPAESSAAPVIINNRVYNDFDDEDEGRQMVYRGSRNRSRSRSRSSYTEWEAEQTRRELEQMRLSNNYREEAELRQAKRELDDYKRRQAREEDEKRIRREMELERFREEEEEAAEKERRDKAMAQAIERYKQQEADRKQKEKEQKERNELEYRRRMQEDLIKSGVDEKAIAAILDKKKVPEASDSKPAGRPVYTRMARRYLSIETLRTFRVEFDVDQDPEFLLIKRSVPEWEQDQFWKHTKVIREKRTKTLLIEEKRHHSKEPQFEWVRKKERRRSKSPGVLMYLAGGRPS